MALEKGREAFLHNRVSDLKRNANGYTAAVLGRQRFEVTVKMREEKPAGISCKCPTARAGQYCEHMAAVLYAIDKEQKTDQGNLAWEQQEEEGRRLREEQEKELARIWREKEEEELRQRQAGGELHRARRRDRQGEALHGEGTVYQEHHARVHDGPRRESGGQELRFSEKFCGGGRNELTASAKDAIMSG